MTHNLKPPQDSPLARWSRLKRAAARAKQEEKDGVAAKTAAAAPSMTAPAEPANLSGAVPTTTSGSAPVTPAADELPPVESLTFESDFVPYFQPQIDAALKRQALKQLLRDPRFNVMDGLDVYIDDYSKPDPIPPEIVREMVQGRYIFDPPPTRINAQGHVEDVPPEELAALQEAKAGSDDEALESSAATETPALADATPELTAVPSIAEPAAAPSAVLSTEDEIPPAAVPSDAPVAKDESAR